MVAITGETKMQENIRKITEKSKHCYNRNSEIHSEIKMVKIVQNDWISLTKRGQKICSFSSHVEFLLTNDIFVSFI